MTCGSWDEYDEDYDPEDEAAEQDLVDTLTDCRGRLERVSMKCEEKQAAEEKLVANSPNVVPLKKS